MTKFREHRGSLADSMATALPCRSRQELVAICKDLLRPFGFVLSNVEKLKVERYVYDDRIGWDTHIVTIPDYGVIGWTDGPE